MKQYMIIIAILCVVVALIIVAVYALSHGTTTPGNIRVSFVQVTRDAVSFEGEFMGSAMWYNGYTTSYKDGVLYLRLQVSSIQLPGMQGDPFVVSIPNTYGTIKQIYLQGQGVDKLIWPQS